MPALAVRGIIDKPVNPFTGKRIGEDKAEGATITTSSAWGPEKHSKYKFKIKEDEWLYVRDTIFDPANWKFLGGQK